MPISATALTTPLSMLLNAPPLLRLWLFLAGIWRFIGLAGEIPIENIWSKMKEKSRFVYEQKLSVPVVMYDVVKYCVVLYDML